MHDGKQFCVIRGFECIQSSGVPVMNELHCTLMTLTFTIFMAKSLNGAIHECCLVSHTRPFTIPLFFSSGGRGRRVWRPCQRLLELENVFTSTASD